jgi:hypothetical protein
MREYCDMLTSLTTLNMGGVGGKFLEFRLSLNMSVYVLHITVSLASS